MQMQFRNQWKSDYIMIVLDNSVLSALTNLDVLDKLMLIIPEVYITQSILEEYSTKWKERIPKNIKRPFFISDTTLSSIVTDALLTFCIITLMIKFKYCCSEM